MAGIEVIVNQILDEAKDREKEILDQAEKEILEISGKARKDVEKIETDLYRQSEKELENYQSTWSLMAEQKKRRAILNAKQAFIENILNKTYEILINEEDEVYFELVLKLVKKYALDEDGEIVFNRRDKERMPDGFMEKIKNLAEEKGGSLELSDEVIKTDGGFVLVYGGIEENCTFKSLFAIEKERLHDLINEIVFC